MPVVKEKKTEVITQVSVELKLKSLLKSRNPVTVPTAQVRLSQSDLDQQLRYLPKRTDFTRTQDFKKHYKRQNLADFEYFDEELDGIELQGNTVKLHKLKQNRPNAGRSVGGRRRRVIELKSLI